MKTTPRLNLLFALALPIILTSCDNGLKSGIDKVEDSVPNEALNTSNDKVKDLIEDSVIVPLDEPMPETNESNTVEMGGEEPAESITETVEPSEELPVASEENVTTPKAEEEPVVPGVDENDPTVKTLRELGEATKEGSDAVNEIIDTLSGTEEDKPVVEEVPSEEPIEKEAVSTQEEEIPAMEETAPVQQTDGSFLPKDTFDTPTPEPQDAMEELGHKDPLGPEGPEGPDGEGTPYVEKPAESSTTEQSKELILGEDAQAVRDLANGVTPTLVSPDEVPQTHENETPEMIEQATETVTY